jgi:hypothetical protein
MLKKREKELLIQAIDETINGIANSDFPKPTRQELITEYQDLRAKLFAEILYG